MWPDAELHIYILCFIELQTFDPFFFFFVSWSDESISRIPPKRGMLVSLKGNGRGLNCGENGWMVGLKCEGERRVVNGKEGMLGVKLQKRKGLVESEIIKEECGW